MGDDSSAPDGVPEALSTPLKGPAGPPTADKLPKTLTKRERNEARKQAELERYHTKAAKPAVEEAEAAKPEAAKPPKKSKKGEKRKQEERLSQLNASNRELKERRVHRTAAWRLQMAYQSDAMFTSDRTIADMEKDVEKLGTLAMRLRSGQLLKHESEASEGDVLSQLGALEAAIHKLSSRICTQREDLLDPGTDGEFSDEEDVCEEKRAPLVDALDMVICDSEDDEVQDIAEEKGDENGVSDWVAAVCDLELTVNGYVRLASTSPRGVAGLFLRGLLPGEGRAARP